MVPQQPTDANDPTAIRSVNGRVPFLAQHDELYRQASQRHQHQHDDDDDDDPSLSEVADEISLFPTLHSPESSIHDSTYPWLEPSSAEEFSLESNSTSGLSNEMAPAASVQEMLYESIIGDKPKADGGDMPTRQNPVAGAVHHEEDVRSSAAGGMDSAASTLTSDPFLATPSQSQPAPVVAPKGKRLSLLHSQSTTGVSTPVLARIPSDADLASSRLSGRHSRVSLSDSGAIADARHSSQSSSLSSSSASSSIVRHGTEGYDSGIGSQGPTQVSCCGHILGEVVL